jgi:membrane associated rhomboid family serine protease
MSEELAYKLRRLFPPAALLSLLLLAAYSALNWFVLSRTAFLHEDVADYWLPLFLAALLELAIILPRLRSLDLGKKNLPLIINLAAVALIAAPTMLAQTYISTSIATISHVEDASDIGKAAQSRYYTASSICVDGPKARAAFQIEASGRQNQYLDITIYAVVPVCKTIAYFPKSILDTSAPPLRDQPGLWVGLSFFKSLDNGLSQDSKKKLYLDFVQQTQGELNKLDTSKYRYLERSARSTERRYFDKALEKGGIRQPATQLVLVPHREAYTPHANDWLMMTGLALGVGLMIWAGIVAVMPLATEEDREQAAKDAVLGTMVVPTRTSYGLPLLLDLNVAVFLAMVFAGLGFISFDSDDLIAWGGNYGPALMQGQFFRLVTSLFVHGGVMHLLNNMYGLVIAGLFLNTALPNWRMILCYLVTGLGGSIASAMLHPALVSVGASGAILGLWGVLVGLALLGDTRLAQQKNIILINGAGFAALTVIIGAFTPGIDNAAHIGGFVAGLAVGGAVFLLDRGKPSRVT